MCNVMDYVTNDHFCHVIWNEEWITICRLLTLNRNQTSDFIKILEQISFFMYTDTNVHKDTLKGVKRVKQTTRLEQQS